MQRKRSYVLLVLLLVLSLTASPALSFSQQLNSKLLMEQAPKYPWDQRPLVVSLHLLKWSQRAVLSLRPLAALASVIHSNKMVPLSSLNKDCTNKKPLSWKEEGKKKTWKTVFKCPLTCDCDTKKWPHLARPAVALLGQHVRYLEQCLLVGRRQKARALAPQVWPRLGRWSYYQHRGKAP